MKKVLIIDDEILARAIIKENLVLWPDFELVAECSDGFEGLKAIQEHNPDLIFLDIQMPKINGFEMMELLENPPAVIFTTAFDEFALRAFEANAMDYLLKPFSKERFDKAIQKYLQHSGESNLGALLASAGKSEIENQRMVVKHKGNIILLPVDSVLYLEAWDDYVKIHTGESMYLKKQTMAFYEKLYEKKGFIRVHRSYLVQIEKITSIEPGQNETWELRLQNGFHVPVSKSGYQKLKAAMGM